MKLEAKNRLHALALKDMTPEQRREYRKKHSESNPSTDAEPVKPVETVKPVQAVKPVKAVKPVAPVKPVKSMN